MPERHDLSPERLPQSFPGMIGVLSGTPTVPVGVRRVRPGLSARPWLSLHLDHELAPDLAARVLGRVHVDVRLAGLHLRELRARHRALALLTGGARPAERHDHGARDTLLAAVDMRGRRRA